MSPREVSAAARPSQVGSQGDAHSVLGVAQEGRRLPRSRRPMMLVAYGRK
jgi:hypothetical protein